MAYVPIDPGDFVPPFSASGDPYGQTWKNHGEVIDAYEQHLAPCGQPTATSGATALAFRFQARLIVSTFVVSLLFLKKLLLTQPKALFLSSMMSLLALSS